jgi:hypothetical protein
MFRTLTVKKKIPVQRYLRKGLENAKGTRHLWRAPKYKLKRKFARKSRTKKEKKKKEKRQSQRGKKNELKRN